MKRNKTIHNKQYSNLIKSLCDERKRLGLSQTEVAIRVNMKQSEISKIETLERRVDAFELKQLLKAYRISENIKLRQLITDFFELE